MGLSSRVKAILRRDLFGITLIVVGILFILFMMVSDPHGHCSMREEILNKQFRGIITDKFLDEKEHRYKTIVINNNHLFRFTRELSGLYDFVQVGDSISKERNFLSLILIRDGVEVKKEMVYAECERWSWPN